MSSIHSMFNLFIKTLFKFKGWKLKGLKENNRHTLSVDYLRQKIEGFELKWINTFEESISVQDLMSKKSSQVQEHASDITLRPSWSRKSKELFLNL